VNPSDSDRVENSPMTDGGASASSDEPDLLTRTADTPDQTWWERTYTTVDRVLLAPARIALTDIRMVTSLVIISFFIFVGTIGTSLIDEAVLLEGPILQAPFVSMEYPLGTDGRGRGMLAQIVHATPPMLKMILSGGLLSVVIGTMLGSTAGYVGGYPDKIAMIITDTVLTIPGLALVVVLSSVWFPENPYLVGLILGIDNWLGLSRTLRSQVLSIRGQSYTGASRAMGRSRLTILRKDVITIPLPYILINFAKSSRRIIFESVALYYLGILPWTQQNWGTILQTAYNNMSLVDSSQYHWALIPMITIIFISMALILFAQGLDRVFNVRLRAKNEKTTEDDHLDNVEQLQ